MFVSNNSCLKLAVWGFTYILNVHYELTGPGFHMVALTTMLHLM